MTKVELSQEEHMKLSYPGVQNNVPSPQNYIQKTYWPRVVPILFISIGVIIWEFV